LNGSYVITSTTTNTYTVVLRPLQRTGSGGGTANVQYEIKYRIYDAGFAWIQHRNYSSAVMVRPKVQVYNNKSRVWALDSYGQQLLAAPYGGLFIFGIRQIILAIMAGLIQCMVPQQLFNAMFVTPERFIFALGINN